MQCKQCHTAADVVGAYQAFETRRGTVTGRRMAAHRRSNRCLLVWNVVISAALATALLAAN